MASTIMGINGAVAFLIVNTLALIVALAWNDAAVNTYRKYLNKDSPWTLVIYAITVTIFAVLIVYLARSNLGMASNGSLGDVEEIK